MPGEQVISCPLNGQKDVSFLQRNIELSGRIWGAKGRADLWECPRARNGKKVSKERKWGAGSVHHRRRVGR